MHTPGPWEHLPDEYNRDDAATGHGSIFGNDWFIATIEDSLEAKANARLIAAAPEMIEALQQIRGFVAVMDASNWRDMRLHIERQCAVITKAEGT